LKKEQARRKIAEDVEKFLARGGQITHIPWGASNDKKNKALTVVAPRTWNGNDRHV